MTYDEAQQMLAEREAEFDVLAKKSEWLRYEWLRSEIWRLRDIIASLELSDTQCRIAPRHP